MKRFGSGQGHLSSKITDPIPVPKVDLNLDEFKSGVNHTDYTVYDLQATSNHFGGTGGGHYTSTTKCWKSNSWLDKNDSQVSKIDSNEAIDPRAIYVLFYCRKYKKSKYYSFLILKNVSITT